MTFSFFRHKKECVVPGVRGTNPNYRPPHKDVHDVGFIGNVLSFRGIENDLNFVDPEDTNTSIQFERTAELDESG